MALSGNSEDFPRFEVIQGASTGVDAAAVDALEPSGELPGGVFETRVLSRRTVSSDYDPHLGTMTLESLHYADGTRRLALLAEPLEERSEYESSSIPLVGTMPWLISAKGGIYLEDFVKPAVAEGYPVLLLSHEGEGEALKAPRNIRGWLRWGKVMSGISLERSARHIHATVDSYAGSANFDSDSIIPVLDSEGAMTAFGSVSLAQDYEREAPYFDIEDPCFLTRACFRDIIALRKAAGEEIEGTSNLVVSRIWNDVRHGDTAHLKSSAKTVNWHPLSLIGEVAYVPALKSGDAGKLARNMPEDTRGTVTYMTNSTLSRTAQESDTLDGFPNIRILPEPGPHTYLAAYRHQRSRRHRLIALRDEMNRTGYHFDRIDWTRLYVGAAAIDAA